MNFRGMIGLILILSLLGGCASRQSAQQQAQEQSDTYSDPKDPLETFNRTMWDFNYDVLDKYILRPTTVAYVDYMPSFARTGLHNMALNLEEPSNSVNNLLQGKVGGSFASLGRFVINSTVGLLGTIDVAEMMGIDREEEEFGEVLGKYGVGTGAYLMLPALGPTDIRSSVGDFVDTAYFPLEDLTFYVAAFRSGIKALEARAILMDQEQLLESSLDKYAFVKDAYFQNLQFRVTDGEGGDDKFSEDFDDAELEGLLDDL